jgi:signal transduction histidine kinase
MLSMRSNAAHWAPPALLAVFVVVGVAMHGPDPLRVAAGVVVVGAGWLIRPGSRWAVAVPAVAAGVGVGFICTGLASNVGWFAVPLLAGWLAVIGDLAVLVPFWAAAVLLFTGEWIFAEPDPGWASWIAGTTFGAIGCWLGRRQRDLADRLRTAQAELAEAARAEERTRIAREVHDVVAHSLTVSLLHVSGARLALADGDAVEAEESLAEAERLGRAALGEVRQAVGVLHHGTPGTAAPLPGIDQVERLVATVRGAGLPVAFAVRGSLEGLPATTGLAIYRILQEALTNSLRHAPGSPTTALIAVAGIQVEVTVANEGVDADATRGTGVGLQGMRQRAEALGGTFTAGPVAGGWRVHATLPWFGAVRVNGRVGA